MVNNQKMANWKLEHFVCYLYLTIGYADNVLLASELEMAKQKLQKFFEQYFNRFFVDIDTVLNEVLLEIEHHSTLEKQETIKHFTTHFMLSDESKMDIISDLTDIVTVDDVVDLEEHKTLAFIRAELSKSAA